MHKVVVPKLSSVHRFACLALYRALLRQCKSLPKPEETQLTTVKQHILGRFHRYKTLQSPSQVSNALKAGYEALDILHSVSQGNQHNANVIKSILSEVEQLKERKTTLQKLLTKARSAKEPSQKLKKKAESRKFQDSTSRKHPNATSILSRPRSVVSGRRHVPVLVNARGVPFLRIKKPQPKNLSGVIRSKLDKRWKRIERRGRLEVELLFGQDEDHWDHLTIGSDSEKWAVEIKSCLDDVNHLIRTNDAKNMRLAEAMWDVVLAERKLAGEEKVDK